MSDEVLDAPETSFGERASSALDRIERVYLKVLRGFILVIATGLLLLAAWLAVSSLWQIAQSPNSVVEQPASVSPDELTDAEMPVRDAVDGANGDRPGVDPNHRRFYADFVGRYHALYRTKFEPFRQKEDKQLTRDQFDDAFVKSADRLKGVSDGELSFTSDKADLETLLTVMSEAADKPQTRERLQKYRGARKVQVAKKVQRTRTESREGWDPYGYSCYNWYENGGCPTIRRVQVPYTETVRTQQFPEGTQSHSQIFRAFQDRFFSLLEERRERARAEAIRKREEISFGNVMGKVTLWTALWVLGGFLVLMFFFLLIAIERHQRRLAT